MFRVPFVIKAIQNSYEHSEHQGGKNACRYSVFRYIASCLSYFPCLSYNNREAYRCETSICHYAKNAVHEYVDL